MLKPKLIVVLEILLKMLIMFLWNCFCGSRVFEVRLSVCRKQTPVIVQGKAPPTMISLHSLGTLMSRILYHLARDQKLDTAMCLYIVMMIICTYLGGDHWKMDFWTIYGCITYWPMNGKKFYLIQVHCLAQGMCTVCLQLVKVIKMVKPGTRSEEIGVVSGSCDVKFYLENCYS